MSAHMGHASSSSSEDEGENQRLMDAVWEHNSRDGVQGRVAEINKAGSNVNAKEIITSKVKKSSVREMIYHDAEEQFGEDYKSVKTTPEFRSYLAKKLSSVLDGQLKMTTSKKETIFDDDKSKRNEEDTLRLFSSSCCAPNLNPCEPGPPVKRKRPRLGRNTKKLNINDDSDSDVQEQRLLEAAISGHEVLSFSSFSSAADHKPQRGQNSSSDSDHTDSFIQAKVADDPTKTQTASKQRDDGFSDSNVEKKKKKKKMMDRSDIHADDKIGIASNMTENGDGGCSHANVEKKKKRKKKKTDTSDSHAHDKTRTVFEQREHEDGEFSHPNVEKRKRRKTENTGTSEIHADNNEHVKGGNCLAQTSRSSELSKKTDIHEFSVEIGRRKKKKKKKRVDINTSNGDH